VESESPTILGGGTATSSPEFTRWTLQNDDILEYVRLLLEGAEFGQDDVGKPTYLIKSKNAILNEYGRRIVLTTMRSVFHRGTTLSTLDEKEISNIVTTTHSKVARELFRNWRKVGVTSPFEIEKLVWEFVSVNVKTLLNRAKGGFTWKELNRLHSVNESISGTTNDGQNKPRGLSFLGGNKNG